MTTIGPARPALDIVLRPGAHETIVGAVLPVTVTLHNPAPAGGVVVDSPQGDMPFVFELRAADGSVVKLSRWDYLSHAMPEPPPPREPDMAPLRAGASLEFPVDLADWMSSPVPAGTYQVIADYAFGGSLFRSAPVSVRIAPPKVAALEVAPSGDGVRLGSVMVNLGSEAVLYQREAVGGRPAIGVFRPRHVLAHPGSVALSMDGEGSTPSRWIGWTQDGAATLSHVWDATVLHTTPPTPLGAGARLLSRGWTFNDDSVLFVGASASSLTLLTVVEQGPPHARSVSAPAGFDPHTARAGLYKARGENRLLLVWSAGERLLACEVNPKGEAGPPRVLDQRPEPVASLDIESVTHDGVPKVAALFTDVARREATLVRFHDGDPPQSSAVPFPPGEGPIQWTVLAGPGTHVLALVGGEHLLAWNGAAWRSLHDGHDPVSFPRLVRLYEVFALWADAGGIRYRSMDR